MAPTLQFHVIDALSKLFLFLVSLTGKESEGTLVQVNLLGRILTAVALVLVEDHKKIGSSINNDNSVDFDQRPYYRLLSNISSHLGVPDPTHDSCNQKPITQKILVVFSQLYLALQPSTIPGFAFSWLRLVSHNTFMPHLLLGGSQKNPSGSQCMHRLLVSLLSFLGPLLKISPMMEPVRVMYKGTLRVMLVLLHDFPDFLCENHLTLCEFIPNSCIQLRNIIVSAYPRSIRPPDPLNRDLKVIFFTFPIEYHHLVVILNAKKSTRVSSVHPLVPPTEVLSSRRNFLCT